MGTLQRVAALPLAEEDLTPEFLGQALGHDIASLAPSGTIRGTGTKLFFDVTYTDADSDGPASICVKGGFGEQVRSFGVAEAYVLEAIFYGDIAARTTLRLPTCFYAAIDDQRTQGIVILEDLRGTGYTFGEPTQPWTPEAVAAGLEQQAMWHAATWNAAADAQGGLGLAVGSTSVRAAAPFLFSAEHVDRQRSVPELAPLFTHLPDAVGFQAAFSALWAWDDAQNLCLAHGDAHVGNTFLDTAGAPGFLDWQCLCLGPWSYDVAYFLVGALEIADRREHQEELLRGYLKNLKAHGGPDLPYEQAFDAYRRSNLHGTFWALTPPEMQPIERVSIMAERHVAAVVDLDTFGALGV